MSQVALLAIVGDNAGFVVLMLKLWVGGVLVPICQLKLRLLVGTFTVPAAGTIVICNCLVCVPPMASARVTWKVNVPDCVGVPRITPVAASNVSPVTKIAGVAVHENGDAPPLLVKVCE